MRLWRFVCNPYAENTYVVAVGERAWVIDPGFYTAAEQRRFFELVEAEGLVVEAIYLTHAHIDHILGVKWLRDLTGAPLYYTQQEEVVWSHAPVWASMMGLSYVPSSSADAWLVPNRALLLGTEAVEVLFVPGHSPGHVAYYFPASKEVISGDVLFRGSIGNYQLPLADYDTLMHSLRHVLLPLGDEVVVWPGHGEKTTIGQEKQTNVFLRDAI